MKQSKRILAYSALALVVMLAAFGAIAFDTSNVAYAQTGTVPAAPTLSAASTGPNSITITWEAVDDAVSYQLWSWDTDDEWQRLDGGADDPPVLLTGLSFVHSDLTPGKTYYYQILAFDSDGDKSGWSARVNEVAGDAPDPPALTPAAGYEQITVLWPAVTSAVSYELHAWDGSWVQLADANGSTVLTATSYTHTGLTADRTIYYQGRSVNAGGTRSAWSAQVSATVLSAPTVSEPQTLAAAPGDGEVTLTWTAPASGAATGYQYRFAASSAVIADATWTDIGNVLTVTVTGLTNGDSYDFEVRAVDSAGNGPAASMSATPQGAPDAPGSLSASPTETTVTYSWSAPDGNGAAVTGYQHQHYESGGTAPTDWVDAGNVTTVTIKTLTTGTTYTFNVRAVNSVGASDAATVDETPSGQPGAPQNLTASGGPGSITLSWDAPAADGGSVIVNYRIEKWNATSTNWRHLITVSGTTEEYTDNSVTIGATTEYRVRAINANTNDLSPWATVPGVAQGKGVPHAPANLVATPSNERISYTWDAPASDGGATISMYEYKYWTGNTEPDDWEDNDRRTSVTLSNLIADSQYSFRVRAVNEVGAGAPAASKGVFASTGPDMPRRFEAQADNTDAEIELSWTDPDEDGGSSVNGYVLEFTTEDDPDEEDWDIVTGFQSADDADDHDHETLTNGVTYYYRVRATNLRCPVGVPIVEGQADCRKWAYANATTVAAATARAEAPDTSFSDGRITVTWEAPADHGRPIISYRLRWMSGTESDFPAANVVSVQAPAAEYIMIGPEVEDNYQFQVLAVNALTDFDDISNDADSTDWSVSSTVLDVPAVTAQLTSGTDGLTAGVPDSNGRSTISWRKVADANYTIASYDLQWVVIEEETLPGVSATTDEDDDGDLDLWDDANSENLAAQALMSRITDPLPGAMYLFARLRVVTTVGTKSAWATTDDVVIPPRAPDNPVLDATIIGQNVLLSWDTPENNGACITHYELQFKKDDGDFGDHDGDDDPTAPEGIVDPDVPDNDVIQIEGADCDADPVVLPDTSYSHEELAANSTYTYRIRTVTEQNDAVAGAARTWSAEAVAVSDPGPPADPVLPGTPTLRATADNTDGHITLKWDPPAVKGTEPITSYQLQRWDGSAWEVLPASLDAMDKDYNDETAELGKRYYYAIRAVSSAGMGEWTQRDFPSDMLNAKAPAKIDLSLSVDGQAITLSWIAPEDNGNAITAYQIQVTATDPDDGNRAWGDGTSANNTISPSPALSTSYTHSGLVPGRTYYYRIRAVNACNDSDALDDVICGDDEDVNLTADDVDWSDEQDETTEPIAPAAPGSTVAGDNLDALTAVGGDAEVALTWELPGPDSDFTDAYHESVGGAPITSVEIQRWNGATSQWDDIKTVDVGFQDDEAVTKVYTTASQIYTDTGLEDGTSYTYRVRAVNSAGDSPWSNMATDATEAARPDLPTLEATVSGQSVTLTWNTPDNNGSPIQRYEIQRFPSIGTDTDGDMMIDTNDVDNEWGNGTFNTGTDDDVIVPMPAGVTTHTDSGLSPSTLYYYRMRAVNSCNDTASGDDECATDTAVQVDGATWSAVVQVTTDAKAPARIPRNTSADDQPIDGLKLTGGENKVTLEWTVPESYGSPISEYQIDRWDSADRMWLPIKRELPASVRSYEDTGLAEGTRYFYRVRAVNGGGEGAWSTLTSATTEEADE